MSSRPERCSKGWRAGSARERHGSSTTGRTSPVTGSSCRTRSRSRWADSGIAGNRLDDPKTDERIARGYEGLNPGVRDPHQRLDEQAVDGICGEVMYPSLNMFTFAIPDRDVVAAVFERHNDWVLDYCSVAPDRLLGIGCLGLPDVEVALAEMERSATRGVRGFAIPAHVDPARPYCHPGLRPVLDRRPGLRRPAHHAHLHGLLARRGAAGALGNAGRHDQGLHAGPRDSREHDDRPHLRRSLRTLSPASSS